MLEGLRSQIYEVADLAPAKAWYTELLGTPPYFDQPFYVGFNVGGYELGLLPSETGETGAVTYWGVPNADAAYGRLLELGAQSDQPIHDVGDGIRLGTVLDPQGNVLGVIENPHFLAAQAPSTSEDAGPGLTFSLHIPQGVLEQAQAGARSARVSLEEYIGECAVDGLYRGYR